MRAFLFLLSISTLLTGCAQRLDELDEKMSDIQQRTSLLEAKTGGPVGNDRELLEGQKLADVRSQMAAMRNDVTVIAGKVEAVEFENKRINNRLESVIQDLEQKIKELSKAAKAAPEARSDSSPAAPGGMPPDAEYDLALKAHQDGDFAKAEKMFEAFVSKHPKHNLADNAIYWIGDEYMSQKMYKKAIAKFQDLVDHYPKSDKRCDAMSKQIQAFSELGMKKEAGVFTQVRDSECK